MALKDTEEQLYKSDSNIENREHSMDMFDEKSSVMVDFFEKKSWWDKFAVKWLEGDKAKAIMFGAIALGVLIVLVTVYSVVMRLKSTAFLESNVSITIEGADRTDSAQNVSYKITYKNKNRVALKEMELVLNHSENFYPQESESLKKINDRTSSLKIKDLGAFESGEVKFSGEFYAYENHIVYLQPVLRYKPNNFNSFFETTAQLGVKIANSPITLTLETPKEVLDESVIEYRINYENTGKVNLNSLNLELEYPDGLIFQESSPSPVSMNNLWHLGNLNVGAKGTIIVKSKIDGRQYDIKLLRASIYKNESNARQVIYGRAENTMKVVVPPLAIDLKVNGKNSGNISLGESLRYSITFANRGDLGLRDVIIKLKVDSPIIDYQKLVLKEGAYDSKAKEITWKAADVAALKNLEPGSSGQVECVLTLKDNVEVKSFEDKNFSIEAVATIDSSDVAYHSLGYSKNISSGVLTKLNSRVTLENSVVFEDNDIKNSGPVPEVVGEETTYTMIWKIKNLSNSISDTKVQTVLPTWVKWKNVVFPTTENLVFNERTQEVIWEVGKLDNGVGFLLSPREIKFQVGIVPEVNQLDRDIKLDQKVFLTAKDDFTGEEISIERGGR
ncbi:MAG: hypothetical protein WAV16_00620 [Candidatus Moraniibacteriota bacterium]